MNSESDNGQTEPNGMRAINFTSTKVASPCHLPIHWRVFEYYLYFPCLVLRIQFSFNCERDYPSSTYAADNILQRIVLVHKAGSLQFNFLLTPTKEI